MNANALSVTDTTFDEFAIQESVRFLSPSEAIKSIAANPYWPKWNSPWWHMAALYEMGLATRIPKPSADALVASLKRQYPAAHFQDGNPTPADLVQTTPCPCELGNIFQILSAAGIDVDQELPWVRPWFLKYQMPDGGLSCDDSAYRASPAASSLVGTIAPLEAILLCARRPFTQDETSFLDRGARCLIERELRLGCSAEHNVEEKQDEQDWLKLCFPRFYLYDVLRGLSFILKWVEKRQQALPVNAIDQVVRYLSERFSDGKARVERHAFSGVDTFDPADLGKWRRPQPATHFPLLTRVSEIGQVSLYLTAQWNDSKVRLEKLKAEGLIT